ncbi:hypothetical protein [Pseudoneobacillus sp. C159]
MKLKLIILTLSTLIAVTAGCSETTSRKLTKNPEVLSNESKKESEEKLKSPYSYKELGKYEDLIELGIQSNIGKHPTIGNNFDTFRHYFGEKFVIDYGYKNKALMGNVEDFNGYKIHIGATNGVITAMRISKPNEQYFDNPQEVLALFEDFLPSDSKMLLEYYYDKQDQMDGQYYIYKSDKVQEPFLKAIKNGKENFYVTQHEKIGSSFSFENFTIRLHDNPNEEGTFWNEITVTLGSSSHLDDFLNGWFVTRFDSWIFEDGHTE